MSFTGRSLVKSEPAYFGEVATGTLADAT